MDELNVNLPIDPQIQPEAEAAVSAFAEASAPVFAEAAPVAPAEAAPAVPYAEAVPVAPVSAPVVPPAPVMPKRFCPGCGNELQPMEGFCPKCGTKCQLPAYPVAPQAPDVYGTPAPAPAKKKKGLLIGIIAGAAALLVLLMALILPKAFVSVEKLCARGDYEKAYSKAKDSEKNEVLAENVIAYLSNESTEMMKVPSSFELRDGYYYVSYNKEKKRIYQQAVLVIDGENGHGDMVTNYWIWIADENGDWDLSGTCTSLDLSYSDDDFYLSVLAKVIIEGDHCYKLSKTSEDNINRMFEDDTLEDVELIDIKDFDKKSLPKDGSSSAEEPAESIYTRTFG